MRPPPPQALVIAGASGDLTRRKILPALYHLFEAGLLPERCAVVGAARTPYSDDEFRAEARTAVERFHSHGIEDEPWERFSRMLFYVPGSYTEPGAFDALEQRVAELEKERSLEGRLYYLATPPSAFEPIIERLEECGVRDDWRVVVEKPFGRDLDSARELNRTVRRALAEE
ncbi:MAG: glucose-6-phosphate dehydrogenase, partial [Vicinamibacteria bacterium]